MPHQQHCQVGIPSLDFLLTILTLSSHIFWMNGRVTIAYATATDEIKEELLPLIMVGRINSEGGGWGNNCFLLN